MVVYVGTISRLLDVYMYLLQLNTKQPNTTSEEYKKVDIAESLFISKEILDLCFQRIAE